MYKRGGELAECGFPGQLGNLKVGRLHALRIIVLYCNLAVAVAVPSPQVAHSRRALSMFSLEYSFIAVQFILHMFSNLLPTVVPTRPSGK